VKTLAASGASHQTDTTAATTEAVKLALARLGTSAQWGVLFASSKHDLAQAMRAARAAAPGCQLIACHTAGEFTEQGKLEGGLVVLLASSPAMVEGAGATGVAQDHAGVARQLTAGFAALAQKAAAKGFGLSTSVLLVDGLAGTGESLVKEVLGGTRAFQQIVGGAAGDDGQFKATGVAGGGIAAADSAAVLHVFGNRAWGVGLDHGLRPTTQKMTVTRATGNVLWELDGKPAFEAYRSYAKGKGVTLEPASAGSFLIGNELGVYFLDELHHARAPVGVGPKGELKLVADMAQGAQVCILDGEPDAMVEACHRAALQAKAGLAGARAAGVLVFDCICRGMILGRQFQRELDAVRRVFPETPLAGFLTYGEIARFRGKLEGWHNTTAVIAAIPE